MSNEPTIGHFDCACYHPAHSIRIAYDEEDNLFYFSYYLDLCHLNFFQRLWLCVKIMFRASRLDYNFHEVILKKEDVDKMIPLLKRVK